MCECTDPSNIPDWCEVDVLIDIMETHVIVAHELLPQWTRTRPFTMPVHSIRVRMWAVCEWLPAEPFSHAPRARKCLLTPASEHIDGRNCSFDIFDKYFLCNNEPGDKTSSICPSLRLL
jgi:hypothetical protein